MQLPSYAARNKVSCVVLLHAHCVLVINAWGILTISLLITQRRGEGRGGGGKGGSRLCTLWLLSMKFSHSQHVACALRVSYQRMGFSNSISRLFLHKGGVRGGGRERERSRL